MILFVYILDKDVSHNLRRSAGSQDSQQTDNLILSINHSQSDQSFEQIDECTTPNKIGNNRSIYSLTLYIIICNMQVKVK